MPTLHRITDSEMRETLVEQRQIDTNTLPEHPKYFGISDLVYQDREDYPALVTGSTEDN
jgi:hypothetical protein